MTEGGSSTKYYMLSFQPPRPAGTPPISFYDEQRERAKIHFEYLFTSRLFVCIPFLSAVSGSVTESCVSSIGKRPGRGVK